MINKKFLSISMLGLLALCNTTNINAEELPANPVAGNEISAESYIEDAYDAAVKYLRDS